MTSADARVETDPAAQTFNAVFTKDHSIGATVRPTIWPTQILYEGGTLAFDILAVASQDPRQRPHRGDPDVSLSEPVLARKVVDFGKLPLVGGDERESK